MATKKNRIAYLYNFEVFAFGTLKILAPIHSDKIVGFLLPTSALKV